MGDGLNLGDPHVLRVPDGFCLAIFWGLFLEKLGGGGGTHVCRLCLGPHLAERGLDEIRDALLWQQPKAVGVRRAVAAQTRRGY